MIQGSFKATIHLSDEQLAMTIIPMIKTVWDSLNLILTTISRSNVKDLMISTCNLIRTQIDVVIKSKDVQQEQLFENLSKNLLIGF